MSYHYVFESFIFLAHSALRIFLDPPFYSSSCPTFLIATLPPPHYGAGRHSLQSVVRHPCRCSSIDKTRALAKLEAKHWRVCLAQYLRHVPPLRLTGPPGELGQGPNAATPDHHTIYDPMPSEY